MVIETDSAYFEPKATLECGQVFRYAALGEQDYRVISADKTARVYKKGDSTFVETDFPEYFENYFDLSTDYAEITARLSVFPELKDKIAAGRGIRILKQDFHETVLSFIISANNNIPRIKGIIERLAENFGEKKDGYNAFPTPDRLKEVSVQTYRELGCGFRDRYLHGTVKTLLETDIAARIKEADTETARKLLCTLKGVGGKVADCILLFSLSRTDVYPTDTWIFKSGKSETLDTPEKVRGHFLARYGRDAGYAQQYLFYAAR